MGHGDLGQNGKCKGPEVEASLVHLRKCDQSSMTRGRVVDNEAREEVVIDEAEDYMGL